MSGHRYGDAQVSGGNVLLGTSSVTTNIGTAIFSDTAVAVDLGLHIEQINASTHTLIQTASDLQKSLLHINQAAEHTPLTLSNITTQCNVVSLSLRLLQRVLGQNSNGALLQFEDVRQETEMSIASCAHTFAMVKQALLPLLTERKDTDGNRADEAYQAATSSPRLRELLDLLRGQQTALQLLLSLWQSQSLVEIQDILQPHKVVMRTLTRRTARSSVSSSKRRANDTESHTFPDVSPFDVSDFNRDLLNSDVYLRGVESLRRLEETGSARTISAILANYGDNAEGAATGSVAESKRSSHIDLTSERGKTILAAIEWAAESEMADEEKPASGTDAMFNPFLITQHISDDVTHQDENSAPMDLALLEKALSDPVPQTQRTSLPLTLKERSKSVWSTRSDPGKSTPKFKVVWVGEPNIGTTDTVFQVLHGRPRQKHERVSVDRTTMTSAIFRGSKLRVELLSTSGMDESDRLMDMPYDHADCIVYGFRISSVASFDAIKQKWMVEVRRGCEEAASVLVGYGPEERADILLMGATNTRSTTFVSTKEAQSLCKEIGATAYLECAAGDSISVSTLWEAVVHAAIIGKYGSESSSSKSRASPWSWFKRSK